MASGQTQYYGLSQWEAADKVERVDFNSDNAKIDGALHALAEQVQPLVRAVPQLAYYIGQLAILDLLDRGQYLGQRAMLYEAFLHPEDLTLSGSAEIRAGVLCLKHRRDHHTSSVSGQLRLDAGPDVGTFQRRHGPAPAERSGAPAAPGGQR